VTAEPPRLLAVLASLSRTLDGHGARWALVGGLAVSVRAEPRFTRDIDVAVAVTDDEAADVLVAVLQAHGFALKTVLEQRAVGRLAAVRMMPPGEAEEGVVVDLLFVSCGIEPEICHEAEPVEVAAGLTVPVARPWHLVR
jgi:predicted nucleotidyltransferase